MTRTFRKRKERSQEMSNKVSIIGAGSVGSTIAYTLAVAGIASEIVMIDINEAKSLGEAMDIKQGIPFCAPAQIYAGSYSDAAGSDIVILTSGSARKPGQTRLDLAQTNVNIIKEVMPRMAKYAPDAIYVVVSNPVDVITYTILKCTDLKPSQVIGTGTALDTSRLRSSIADHVGLSPNSIHAYVFGEHGDTSMIPWSITNVAGIPMYDYCKQEGVDIDKDAIAVEVRKAGGEVIKRKGATFYAIAMTANKVCDNILRDANTIMTVSTLQDGSRYGINDVCLSLPAVVGRHGIEQEVNPALTDEEVQKLQDSAKALRNVIDQIDI